MSLTAWIALTTIALTLLVQFASIVWFAATQRTMLKILTETVQKLEQSVQALDGIATALDKRVVRLEERVGPRRIHDA